MLLFKHRAAAHWWSGLTVLACVVTLLSNTIYLDFGSTPRFLLEKGPWAHEPWWLAAFTFHILGASFCLAVGLPLMFPAWTRKHAVWHRRLGYGYFNAVLWMAAPSGVALALVAKGGLLATAAFALAGVLWWHATWSGYRAIRRGDLPGHIRWLIRSYCWALSAPAFRAIQLALFVLGVPDGPNYLISLWLSIATSVWLAESYLRAAQRSPQTWQALTISHPGAIP